MALTDYDPRAGSMQHVLANVPGLSYRMLDFWSRTGRLACVPGTDFPGSGGRRLWPTEDYPAIRRMVLLARAGLPVDLARALAFRQTSQIAPGVWLTFALEML